MLVHVITKYALLQASTKHVSESIAKKIHENAAPIVEWLRNAEEESSGEEEEDEDEVEVVYSEQAGSKGITTITEQAPQPAEQVHSCDSGTTRSLRRRSVTTSYVK